MAAKTGYAYHRLSNILFYVEDGIVKECAVIRQNGQPGKWLPESRIQEIMKTSHPIAWKAEVYESVTQAMEKSPFPSLAVLGGNQAQPRPTDAVLGGGQS